jgi:hypothetical protein
MRIKIVETLVAAFLSRLQFLHVFADFLGRAAMDLRADPGPDQRGSTLLLHIIKYIQRTKVHLAP